MASISQIFYKQYYFYIFIYVLLYEEQRTKNSMNLLKFCIAMLFLAGLAAAYEEEWAKHAVS